MTAFVSSTFTHTADTDLTSFGWSKHRGSIFSDATGTKATPVFTSASEYYLPTVTPPSADYAVRADITFGGTEADGSTMGVTARNASSEATYYFAFAMWNSVGGQFIIRRMRAGSATALVTVGAGTMYNTPGTYAAELRVVTNGSQVDLEFWWDGVLVASYSDTHANRITDAGYPGIGKNSATRWSSFWDNFEAEVIGGAGAVLEGSATASASATGALDEPAAALEGSATGSATASGALAATAPTVSITSFAASGADLVIGYTHTSVGSSPLLTASLERDGTPIADATTSTLSGTFTITDPGAGVYTLTLLDLTDSEGTDTDGPWGSTATILGAAAHLEGDADAAGTATGALTTGIALAGAAIISTAATGDLSTAVQLAAAAIASGQATGELAGAITLQGAAVTATLASGELTAQIKLGGAAMAAAGASGDITTLIVLQGAAVASLLASAALTTAPSGLAGDATAGVTAAGSLTTAIQMVGGAQVSVIASGAVGTTVSLAGAAVAVVTATGDLVIALELSAAAVAAAVAGADLTTAITLRADAVAGAQASGSLGSGAVVVPGVRRRRVLVDARSWRRNNGPARPARI